MSLRKFLIQCHLTAVLAMPLAAFADPTYSVTLLPSDFTAAKINDAGQIVGTWNGTAAIWANGTMSFVDQVALPRAYPVSINGDGAVSGTIWQGGVSNAFMYADGHLINVGAALTGYDGSDGLGINNAGQVIGQAYGNVGGMTTNGFVYSDGNVQYLGSLSGGNTTNVSAINNNGQIVGSANVADGSLHAYLYDHGTMSDLGTFGGYGATPFDINDFGQMVAGVTLDATGTSSHAILYANGIVTDLGSLGGAGATPLAVNNDGTAIGWSFLDGHSNMHGFVYQDGKMADLNLLANLPAGWTISMARDINDAGQIIARGCNGTTGACSWMELSLISPVPEPAAPALFLAGLLPLVWRARPGWRAGGRLIGK